MKHVVRIATMAGVLAAGVVLSFGGGIWPSFGKASHLDKLAQRYGTTVEPQGLRYTHQTVQIGPVRWRRCVTVVASPQGLYLAISAIFSRFGPLLIPWSELHPLNETIIYWRPAMRLDVGWPPIGQVTLMKDLYTQIQTYLVQQSARVDGR